MSTELLYVCSVQYRSLSYSLSGVSLVEKSTHSDVGKKSTIITRTKQYTHHTDSLGVNADENWVIVLAVTNSREQLVTEPTRDVGLKSEKSRFIVHLPPRLSDAIT